jgi:hypothetical protein
MLIVITTTMHIVIQTAGLVVWSQYPMRIAAALQFIAAVSKRDIEGAICGPELGWKNENPIVPIGPAQQEAETF